MLRVLGSIWVGLFYSVVALALPLQAGQGAWDVEDYTQKLAEYLSVQQLADQDLADFDRKLDAQVEWFKRTGLRDLPITFGRTYARLLVEREHLEHTREELIQVASVEPEARLVLTEAALTNDVADLVAAVPGDSVIFQASRQEPRSRPKLDTRNLSRRIDQEAEQIEERWKKSLGTRGAPEIAPSIGARGNVNGDFFETGRWALTFDDGPHGVSTPRILESLKQTGVKATFFWLASLVQMYPQIVEQAKIDGHTLANHSFTHANLQRSNEARRMREIAQSAEVMADVYGFAPRFFRCPYGACGTDTGQIRQLIADHGMVHVFWNVDSLDWRGGRPEVIAERVRKQMQVQGQGVILFLDIHERSVYASQMIMEDLQLGAQQGYLQSIVLDDVWPDPARSMARH